MRAILTLFGTFGASFLRNFVNPLCEAIQTGVPL